MGLSGIALAICDTDGAGVTAAHDLRVVSPIGHAATRALLMQRPAIESRL